MVLYPQAERGELDEVKVLKVSVSPKVLGPCTLLLRVSLKALKEALISRKARRSQKKLPPGQYSVFSFLRNQSTKASPSPEGKVKEAFSPVTIKLPPLLLKGYTFSTPCYPLE